MKRFLRNNGLSLVIFGLFAVCEIGLSAVGLHQHNAQRREHDQPTLSYAAYVESSAFLEATMENWESEFLQMFAYVFLTAAMRVLPALEVSLLLLIEPVLNPIWTWMIRGERPGTYTLIGGAIIIAATAIKSIYDSRVQGSEGDPSPQTQVP